MRNIFISTFMLFLLVGCSSKGAAPLDTSASNNIAKRFKVKDGFANIYIYNDTMIRALVLDSKILGQLKNDGFFKIEVKPGKHVVELTEFIHNMNNEKAVKKIILNAVSGKNYFIKIENHIAMPGYVSLHKVPSGTGKYHVEQKNLMIHRGFKTTKGKK